MIYQELDIVRRIFHTVLNNQDVNSLLNEILDILDKDMGASRATLTLFVDDVLKIIASKGLTLAEINRGRYKLGEGITGAVAKSKKSILINDISKDKNFLNRTESRKNALLAFICCPIVKNNELIGTISINLNNDDLQRVASYHQVVNIIASFIADAVSMIRDENNQKEVLKNENRRLLKELKDHFRPENIIGSSSAIKQACSNVAKAVKNILPVLIYGEEGTGKELFAKAIHYNSSRCNAPFINFYCSSIPESLLENDIFGSVEGNKNIGYIAQAEGGTLFINEIYDLPKLILEKLEYFLSNRTYCKVGSSKFKIANVRVIVASCYDLNLMSNQGLFSQNLYKRLKDSLIILPKLSQRKSDIILLTEYFLKLFNKTYGQRIQRFSTPAIDMLLSYHWPNNVGELYNCIEQAFLNSSNDVIHGYDLPPSLQISTSKILSGQCDLVTAVNNYERELIIEALKANYGNAAATARALKTTPRILNYKFNKLNIDLKSFKKSR